jgi:cysteine desulfurase
MAQVYLDNYAATPIIPEAREAMLPFLESEFGNPSSLHSWGDRAREAVEEARGRVASLINAEPEEIIFTSNGSEANNLAVKGLAGALKKRGEHVVVSAVEHFSVLNPVKTLEKSGFEVTVVPVDPYGTVDLQALEEALRKDTVLVSVMAANGEIGTVEPLAEAASLAAERGIAFHTDAVAAAAFVDIDVKETGITALSLASDLLYGPKGAGALFLRKGTRILPQVEGGVQEGGRRSGTENVPSIVGMGVAAELAASLREERSGRLSAMRDQLIRRMLEEVPHIRLTGHPTERLPWNASFVVDFIEGESMLLFLDQRGIAVSSGSACTSRALKRSHVLDACGVPVESTQGSILFSFGLENRPEDVDAVMEALPPIVERLRQMSPLYAKFLREGGA